jgi:hypothetical protein
VDIYPSIDVISTLKNIDVKGSVGDGRNHLREFDRFDVSRSEVHGVVTRWIEVTA